MKKYLVIFGNDNKILFQDEIGIADPEEVLNLLNNGKAQVVKEEKMEKSHWDGDYSMFHVIRYTIEQFKK